jgi:hypothetical protein
MTDQSEETPPKGWRNRWPGDSINSRSGSPPYVKADFSKGVMTSVSLCWQDKLVTPLTDASSERMQGFMAKHLPSQVPSPGGDICVLGFDGLASAQPRLTVQRLDQINGELYRRPYVSVDSHFEVRPEEEALVRIDNASKYDPHHHAVPSKRLTADEFQDLLADALALIPTTRIDCTPTIV